MTEQPEKLGGDKVIRLTLNRMSKLILEGSRDPLVIITARKIAELSIDTARQLGRPINDETKDLICLEGVHAWCRANFQFLRDPLGTELIQTANRQLRSLDIPVKLAAGIWEPIRDAMASSAGKDAKKLTLPKPKMTGDSDEAVIVSLALVVALNITPVKMRLGGRNGAVQYVWGAVLIDNNWLDFDILHEGFGRHYAFEQFEDELIMEG